MMKKDLMSQFKLIPTYRKEPLKIREINQSRDKDLIISTHTDHYLIRQQNIQYVQGQGNYAKIFLQNEKPLMVSRPLSYYQNQLSCALFIRIHQSYLVNRELVISVARNGSYLTLAGGEKYPISRRKRHEVFAAFGI